MRALPGVPGILIMLATMPAATVAIATETETEDSRAAILAKYPSAADIDEQFRRLELAQPELVKDILEDFDLAIRTVLSREAPTEDIPQPHGGRRLMLVDLGSREGWENWLNEEEGFAKIESYAKYIRDHLDDMTLVERPELPVVMMHVLLHEWKDWTAWSGANEWLSAAREKWPELHRIYAARELKRLRHAPSIGALLRIVADRANSLALRDEARTALRDIGNYEDVLQFYIDWALDSPNCTDLGHTPWIEIYMVARRMDKSCAFWERYLESRIPTLWYLAQESCDRPLPDRGAAWLMDAQEQWDYEHEPDPDVRRLRDLTRRRRELLAQKNPETHRRSLSPDDIAELQAIAEEMERLQQIIKQRAALIERPGGTKSQP